MASFPAISKIHPRKQGISSRLSRLSVEESDEVLTERRCADGNNLLHVLSALWSVSLEQPQRTPKEFFLRPAVPIRDVYTTRLLVNLLWFSRNYHNMALLISLFVIFCAPPCALIVTVSCIMHITKRYTSRGTPSTVSDATKKTRRESGRSGIMVLLTLLQIGCCIYVWYLCGFFSVVMCIATVATPIVAHAFFTPYTDDAFELYCEFLRKRYLPAPRPCSPTRSFSSVDPTFEVLNRLGSVSMSPTRSNSGRGNRPFISPHSFTLPLCTHKKEKAEMHLRIKYLEPPECQGRYSPSSETLTENSSFSKEVIDECIDPVELSTPVAGAENSTELCAAASLRHLKLHLNIEGVTLLQQSQESGVIQPLQDPLDGDNNNGVATCEEETETCPCERRCTKESVEEKEEEGMSLVGSILTENISSALSSQVTSSPRCGRCVKGIRLVMEVPVDADKYECKWEKSETVMNPEQGEE
ncbi:putative PRA1 family protein [Trypanosoma cruzi]|nr:putative PRA1 family protein [Trypanosoma cruzi]